MSRQNSTENLTEKERERALKAMDRIIAANQRYQERVAARTARREKALGEKWLGKWTG